MRFDGYIFRFRPRDLAIKVVEAGVFFKIEARDEAVHEAMAAGEVTIELIDVMQDWGEIAVDAVSIPTADGGESGER